MILFGAEGRDARPFLFHGVEDARGGSSLAAAVRVVTALVGRDVAEESERPERNARPAVRVELERRGGAEAAEAVRVGLAITALARVGPGIHELATIADG